MREYAKSKTSDKNTLSEDVIEKLSKAKTLLQSTLGQIILAMAAVPRYKHYTLAGLSHLVIDPLVRDRIAIAYTNSANNENEAQLNPPAIAIWASVSEDVSGKLEEQVKAGVFPIRLKPTDWNSGDIVWLLDVIAPTREIVASILANFNKIGKQDQIHIHPIVGNLVDRDVLKKLAKIKDGDAAAAAKPDDFSGQVQAPDKATVINWPGAKSSLCDLIVWT